MNLAFSQKNVDKVYVKDIPTKILGKAYLNFITVEDDIIKKIDYFEIKYSKNQIIKIIHSSEEIYSKDFKILKSGDILFNNKIAYNDLNFDKNKIYSEKFYKLLNNLFLKFSNTEKLNCINSIFLKLNKIK